MANSLRFGPPTASTAHLCVDMQNVFAEDTPWRTSWMERVRPVVAELARYKPHSTVFSRFMPPDRPEDAKGAWRRYFERWQDLTRQNIDPQLLELVPELQELVPPAVIFDKRVYSPFHDGRLSPYLRRGGSTASSSRVPKQTSASWRRCWPRSIMATASSSPWTLCAAPQTRRMMPCSSSTANASPNRSRWPIRKPSCASGRG